jgi:hypothetical protein
LDDLAGISGKLFWDFWRPRDLSWTFSVHVTVNWRRLSHDFRKLLIVISISRVFYSFTLNPYCVSNKHS